MTNDVQKISSFQNVYELTQVESVMLDQNNASGSTSLPQKQIINLNDESIEDTTKNDINQNFKANLGTDSISANENTDTDQNIDTIHNKSDKSQPQMKMNNLFLNQNDLSLLQPLETSPDLDSICEKELALFQKNGTIPDPSRQQQLLQYIQRQKVNAIVSSNFREASKLQSACQNLINAINESQVVDTFKIKMDDIEKKIIETKQKINEINNETQSTLAAEQSLLNQKKEDIIHNQDLELDQFEEKWNDEDFLRKFTKPSSMLIAKQSLQHSYILMKDFDRAEELKNEIRSMEKSESQEAQNKAESEMLKEQKKLIEKHQNEMETFNQFYKRQIDIITSRQELKLEPLIARKNKLEKELNSIKQMRACQINLPSLPSIQIESKSNQSSCFNSSSPSSRLCTKTPAINSKGNLINSSLGSVMTPRTVQRYTSYKVQIRNPKITLKPLGKIITNKDKKKIISRNRAKI
ncbi:hypothetical protein M9Y10_012876 [Tritrichomonas musculus]|uniref:Uncharacterized protein n=1 Tax=Tritrichomonas musculus TaxID=1915356 RepID=A0ABR2IDU0_9EUKA